MKHLLRKILPAVLGLLSVGTVTAQDFTLSGEVRPRTEYRHGFSAPVSNDSEYALFTDQRTRLNFKFDNQFLTFYGVFQDVRTWGSESQLNYSEGAHTGLHEAWAIAKLSPKFGLKVGRQEISLDDQRIFGAVGWTQQARSHDMANLIYTDSTIKAQFGIAYNQDSPQKITTDYTVGSNYKAMQFLHVHKDFNKNVGLSLLFLNNGKQVYEYDAVTGDQSDAYIKYSQTVGGRFTYKKNGFFANASLYYQFGNEAVVDSVGTKISAHNIGLEVGKKLNEKITAIVGFERLSGNDQVDGNDKQNAFNPFYGTNHKFNGVMDWFYVGNYAGSTGLNDVYLKGKFKIKKHSFGADVHGFVGGGSILDKDEFAASGNTQSASAYLGTELDLYYSTKINKAVTIKAGYSQMFMTQSMTYVKGGDKDVTQNWAYLMLVFKPTLFNHKVTAVPTQ
jgi:hypothetical protein